MRYPITVPQIFLMAFPSLTISFLICYVFIEFKAGFN
ncbi:hypothetical protein L1276_003002 [Flavobacterium sp. HSC-32F16]|nr:hypothetical protein [Flavobacterium sp. HSC-32F16]